MVFESRAQLQPSFEDLIDRPIQVLEEIADRMDSFAAEWRQFAASAGLTPQQLEQCHTDRASFE